MQVVFNGKCIETLPNWRLVAGGGNRQVKLRAGSNVLIVKKFNSYIPGDKTLCQNALHKFGRFNLFCWNFRYPWLATHMCPFVLHLGGLSLLWTTPIIIRPQPNRGTKRTETGLYQDKKGKLLQLFTPGTNENPWNSHLTGYIQGTSYRAGANHFSRT